MADGMAIPAARKAEPSFGRRHAADRRFRLYGMAAIGVAVGFLVLLLGSIAWRSLPAFLSTEIRLPIVFDRTLILGDGGEMGNLAEGDYAALERNAMLGLVPEAAQPSRHHELMALVGQGGALILRRKILGHPRLLGSEGEIWLPASAVLDQFEKGKLPRDPAKGGPFSPSQLAWIDRLQAEGRIALHPDLGLFTEGNSQEAEMAGLWGSLVGTVLTLCVTLACSFPLGVATAVYLEDYAAKSRWVALIETNIDHLAMAPTIVFGLLGLQIFLCVLGLPRATPLVGGLVLTLVSLPTTILAARRALAAVPQAIREAALGLGASRFQVVIHHVLPLAMPGILSATMIGMARAIGEAAPLLMIGMVAFIVDVPGGPLDPAVPLPVQIYLWSSMPNQAFIERTSAAIMVLLALLGLIYGGAVLLRKSFERRW